MEDSSESGTSAPSVAKVLLDSTPTPRTADDKNDEYYSAGRPTSDKDADAAASSSFLGSTCGQKEPQSPACEKDAEGGELTGDGGMNPMHNDVILAHLFRLCPHSTLAPARLVCRQWNAVSLPIWRSSFPITLTNEGGGQISLLTHSPASENIPLHNFLEYVEDPKSGCDGCPFCNLKLKGWRFNSGDEQEQLQRFWKLLGGNATTLELVRCHFSSVQGFREVIYKSCPKLKHLKLETCSFNKAAPVPASSNSGEGVGDNDGSHGLLKSLSISLGPYEKNKYKLPVTWLELFTQFSDLTDFRLVNTMSVPHSELIRLIYSIRVVRADDQRKLAFKRFEITPLWVSASPTTKLLELIKSSALPLQTLSFWLDYDMTLEDDATAKEAIGTHRTTLRKMAAFAKYPSIPKGWVVPIQVGLSKLEDFYSITSCKDLGFLQYTPNLKSLAVTNMRVNVDTSVTPMIRLTRELQLANLKLSKLTELDFSYYLRDADLQSLFQWMPNVQRLSIVLNDKQFGMVCGFWRELKELTVDGQELTDRGVTGAEININGGSLVKLEEALIQAQAMEIVRVHPNVTDLENLEKFKFSSWAVTEVSVFHGFLHLPKLRLLQSLQDDFEWREAAARALQERNIVQEETYNEEEEEDEGDDDNNETLAGRDGGEKRE